MTRIPGSEAKGRAQRGGILKRKDGMIVKL